GEDFPREALHYLKERGVNLDHVVTAPGRSFRWEGRYHYDMNTRDTLKTELGVLAGFTPKISPSCREGEHLFLGNIHPAVQMQVLEQVRARTVSLDTMNLWIETERKGLEQVMARVDLMVLNEEEARQLSGEYSLVKAARTINRLGPRILVIKRGEYGALLFYKGEIFSAPGLPLEAVKDPTGAGDSFAGGLIGYLDRSGPLDFETLKKGVIMGSVMASFNVEDFGPNRLKKLGRDEIRGRIEEFRRLAHFEPLEV
ncbi:MAG: sugar kinase, partial [Deltaproteobacteria bacterium]|nr:sugar kinase [Deltaproteobacteria bacterium]